MSVRRRSPGAGRCVRRIPRRAAAARVQGFLGGPDREASGGQELASGFPHNREFSRASIGLQVEVSGSELQVGGQVARVEAEGIGIRFTEVPLDSLDDLRNLILYNSPDPDQVEREFGSNLGLKPRG